MKSYFLALAKEMSHPACAPERRKRIPLSCHPADAPGRRTATQSSDRRVGGTDYPSKPPPGGQGTDFIFAAENECRVYRMARFPQRSHPLCCSVCAPRSGDTFSSCRSLPPSEPQRFSVIRPDCFKGLTAGDCGNSRSYLDIPGNSSQLSF